MKGCGPENIHSSSYNFWISCICIENTNRRQMPVLPNSNLVACTISQHSILCGTGDSCWRCLAMAIFHEELFSKSRATHITSNIATLRRNTGPGKQISFGRSGFASGDKLHHPSRWHRMSSPKFRFWAKSCATFTQNAGRPNTETEYLKLGLNKQQVFIIVSNWEWNASI